MGEELVIPQKWTWFWQPVYCIFKTAYVLLKARLPKSSVVIPTNGQISCWLPTLCIVFETYSKNQTLDNKDRQNFEADTHLASFSVLSMLEEMPIQGPLSILVHLENLIDAFLNEQISSLHRAMKERYNILLELLVISREEI